MNLTSQQLQDRHWQKNGGWFRGCGRTLQEEDAKTWSKESDGEEKKGCGYNNQELEAGANGGMERVGDTVASETECILYNAKHSLAPVWAHDCNRRRTASQYRSEGSHALL